MVKATSGLYGNSKYWPAIKGRERLFVFCPQSFGFFFQRKTQAKHVLKLRMKTSERPILMSLKKPQLSVLNLVESFALWLVCGVYSDAV